MDSSIIGNWILISLQNFEWTGFIWTQNTLMNAENKPSQKFCMQFSYSNILSCFYQISQPIMQLWVLTTVPVNL